MTSPAPVDPADETGGDPTEPATRPAPARRTGGGRAVLAVLGSAAAVGALGFLGALLAFFIGNGHTPEVFVQLTGHFALAGFFAAALLAISNAAGALRTWFLALISGFAAAVLAAILATTVTVLATGRGISGELFLFVVGSLVSLNLVFVLLVTFGELWLAPFVARAIQSYQPERTPRRIALVRIPASNLAEGELTHLERLPVDQAKADEQWDNYCATLVAEGWETVEVDAAPELADSVFVEDTVVLFEDLAVITSPGAASRRGETEGVERSVRDLPGLELARIEAPGTLEGGDVLKVGRTVYVGASSRTNAEGIRQLRALLDGRDYTVVAVPVTRALHLKSAVTALPDGTVIGHPELVDAPSLFPRFLPVPEREGVAVVLLSDDTLLMSAAAPRTAELLSGLGYRVLTVDISEFEKLEGCVTCLSVRVR
ncbi:dimethylargininase [Agromyces sp. NPDC060279]|uniref:dimethylargininase n=1 Tax=Agromyces sp. NPDC060279 TaxID=3347092 RepID=UPI003649BA02